MRYSYKQHCMVSLAVADAVDQSEWHLPTFDPQNQNKYHYKLHSLDIYFWTQQDALQFVNGVRRVLPPAQVEVLDEPAPPQQQQQQAMSSVVQKLENAAISDPSYSAEGAGSQRSSQMNLPPPPPGGPPQQQQQHQQQQPPTNFAPMAYNPAAPAAPETIQHREKTPPPDEDPLNPLAVAVAYDYQKQPFTPGFPPQANFPLGVASPGLPPSLGSPGVPPPNFGGPPQHPGVQRAATMPLNAGMPSPGLASPYGSGFAGAPANSTPPQQQQQPHHPPQQPQSQPLPSVTSPGLPPPPPGGYANYTYGQQGQPVPSGADQYAIHQQAYRPTEAEALTGAGHNPYVPKQESKGRLEENSRRLERGMTGMLKKFEKKFG